MNINNNLVMMQVEGQMKARAVDQNKSYSCCIIVLLAILIFVVVASASALAFVYFQPNQYRQELDVVIQHHAHQSNRFFSILENSQLKKELCGSGSGNFVSMGNSISKQQFCHFNYKQIPSFSKPFDLKVVDLQASNAKFIQICLHKKIEINEQDQIVEKPSKWNFLSKIIAKQQPIPTKSKQICQKYKAQSQIQIGNQLHNQDIYLIQISIYLKQEQTKTGTISMRLLFEVETGKLMSYLMNYYFLIAVLVSVGAAGWLSLVFGMVSLSLFVKRSLKGKKILSDSEQQKLQQDRQKRD